MVVDKIRLSGQTCRWIGLGWHCSPWVWKSFTFYNFPMISSYTKMMPLSDAVSSDSLYSTTNILYDLPLILIHIPSKYITSQIRYSPNNTWILQYNVNSRGYEWDLARSNDRSKSAKFAHDDLSTGRAVRVSGILSECSVGSNHCHYHLASLIYSDVDIKVLKKII